MKFRPTSKGPSFVVCARGLLRTAGGWCYRPAEGTFGITESDRKYCAPEREGSVRLRVDCRLGGVGRRGEGRVVALLADRVLAVRTDARFGESVRYEHPD